MLYPFTLGENSEMIYILDILTTFKMFVSEEIAIFGFDYQKYKA